MDPAALLHPVGPEPARIYWIRRIVVVVAVVIVLALLRSLFSGGGGQTAATKQPVAGRTTPPAAAAPASPSASGPVAPSACEVALLTLAVKPSALSYPTGGALPTFALTVTQTGSMPCTLDLGAEQLAAVVSKGSVRVWSSADCGSAAPAVVTLTPNKPHVAMIFWGRQRSAPSCPSAAPGGVEDGSYTVKGQLRGLADASGGSFTLS